MWVKTEREGRARSGGNRSSSSGRSTTSTRIGVLFCLRIDY